MTSSCESLLNAFLLQAYADYRLSGATLCELMRAGTLEIHVVMTLAIEDVVALVEVSRM